MSDKTKQPEDRSVLTLSKQKGIDIIKGIAEREKTMWVRYAVELKFCDQCHGGIPKHPDVIRGWLESLEPPLGDLVEETQKQMKLTKEEKELMVSEGLKGVWSGFKRDTKGIYIEERQFKACLREAAVTLGLTQKTKGSKQVLQIGISTKPERLRFYDDKGKIVTEPDGHVDGMVHTWAGAKKVDALKRNDYTLERTLKFDLWVLDQNKVGEQYLVDVLCLAREGGLGANRSQGVGKHNYLKCERTA